MQPYIVNHPVDLQSGLTEHVILDTRQEVIADVVTSVITERELQIKNGCDLADNHHSPADWVSILVRHIGLSMKDCAAPQDDSLFELQMIRTAAVALAAIEFHRRRHPPVRVVNLKTERIPNLGDSND